MTDNRYLWLKVEYQVEKAYKGSFVTGETVSHKFKGFNVTKIFTVSGVSGEELGYEISGNVMHWNNFNKGTFTDTTFNKNLTTTTGGSNKVKNNKTKKKR